MSMEPTPALTPIGPFETGFKPVQEITPFTYQDGYTYLQKLEVLTYYVNEKLVGTVNDIITADAGFQTNVADTINAFTDAQNAAMKSLASSLIQYQVLNSGNGELSYMMEDGSHIGIYSVAGIDALLGALGDRVTANTVLLNGEIQNRTNSMTELQNSVNSQVNSAISDNGMLVGAFTGDGVGTAATNGEELSLFYSPDGKVVYSNPNNPVYTPIDGLGLRDPSIMYMNGKLYCAYTRNNGADKNIGIASSVTGQRGSWSLISTPSGATVPSMVRMWAPEWIVDDNGDVYIFFSTINASNTGSIWYMKATNSDLTTFTNPVRLQWNGGAEPVHYIDGTFIKYNNQWYGFFSTGDYIIRAHSDTLTGVYTLDKTGDWANWGMYREAPEVVWDSQKNVFRIFIDRYRENTGYAWAESTDLTNWTGLTTVLSYGALRNGENLRHGSFVPLSDKNQANAVAPFLTSLPALQHMEYYGTINLANAAEAHLGDANTGTVINVDANESNSSIVGWDGHSFIFTEKGDYSIDMNLALTAGNAVVRSFCEFTDWGRTSGGAEDSWHACYRIKTKQANFHNALGIFVQGAAGCTVVFRIRFTLERYV